MEFAAAEYGGPDVKLGERPEPVGVHLVDTDGGQCTVLDGAEGHVAPVRVRHELRLACHGQQTGLGLLALHRSAGEPVFPVAGCPLLATVPETFADKYPVNLWSRRRLLQADSPFDCADHRRDFEVTHKSTFSDVGRFVLT